MVKQMAFRLAEQNKAAYAQSIKPLEYNYSNKIVLPKPIVIPITNTKRILSIKSWGGGL